MLHPTPPPMTSSFLSVCASARSDASTSIANVVSWSVKHLSSGVAFIRCRLVRMPEKLVSIPFTT